MDCSFAAIAEFTLVSRSENPLRKSESEHKISGNHADLIRLKSNLACRNSSTRFEECGAAWDGVKIGPAESRRKVSRSTQFWRQISAAAWLKKSRKFLLTGICTFHNLGGVGSP